jgi:TetR/AcrR family transcriptional regulator
MNRKAQILHALAQMLERPHSARITTAALASQVRVSEAALYRHFASKAQMFEALIESIENDIFGLMDQIRATGSGNGTDRTGAAVVMLLSFAEQNRGLTRILTGDALVTEDERLQERINHCIDRIEAAIRQMLRDAVMAGDLPPTDDIAARASLILGFVMGRWQRFAKSGWRHAPTQHASEQMTILLGNTVRL